MKKNGLNDSPSQNPDRLGGKKFGLFQDSSASNKLLVAGVVALMVLLSVLITTSSRKQTKKNAAAQNPVVVAVFARPLVVLVKAIRLPKSSVKFFRSPHDHCGGDGLFFAPDDLTGVGLFLDTAVNGLTIRKYAAKMDAKYVNLASVLEDCSGDGSQHGSQYGGYDGGTGGAYPSNSNSSKCEGKLSHVWTMPSRLGDALASVDWSGLNIPADVDAGANGNSGTSAAKAVGGRASGASDGVVALERVRKRVVKMSDSLRRLDAKVAKRLRDCKRPIFDMDGSMADFAKEYGLQYGGKLLNSAFGVDKKVMQDMLDGPEDVCILADKSHYKSLDGPVLSGFLEVKEQHNIDIELIDADGVDVDIDGDLASYRDFILKMVGQIERCAC